MKLISLFIRSFFFVVFLLFSFIWCLALFSFDKILKWKFKKLFKLFFCLFLSVFVRHCEIHIKLSRYNSPSICTVQWIRGDFDDWCYPLFFFQKKKINVSRHEASFLILFFLFRIVFLIIFVVLFVCFFFVVVEAFWPVH